MLRFILWEVGLLIRGMSLTCFDVVMSPFLRNSPRFERRMHDRWCRLCGEADLFIMRADRLHAELQDRWDLRD